MLPRIRHGFTLIEMLMVVLIIGMLVSLLIPAVSAARLAYNRTLCLNNMRQIGLGMSNYANEFQTLAGNANDTPQFTIGTGTSPDQIRDLRWLYIADSTVDDLYMNGPASATHNPSKKHTPTAWTVGTGSPPSFPIGNQRVLGLLTNLVEINRNVFQCPTFKAKAGVGDLVALHYAVPTILSGLPLEQVVSCYYQHAGGPQKMLPGVPLIVEPEAFVNNSDHTVTTSLGVYDNLSNPKKWSALPNGAFEGSSNLGDPVGTAPADCRHGGKILMGFMNSAQAIDFGTTEISTADIHITLSNGHTMDLTGTNSWNTWLTK